MRQKRTHLLIALLAVLALFVAACGDSSNSTTGNTTTTTEPEAMPEDGNAMDDTTTTTEPEAMPEDGNAMDDTTTTTEPEAMPEDDMTLPGEGVDVTMARADWSTGYFQAQVYKQVLEELGYNVSEPSEKELGPSLAYLAMAQGDIDFWTNSWFPAHDSWFEPELPDGSTVGDHLVKVGTVFAGGGLQGFLITKATADEYGIQYLDQINDDPAIRDLFDTNGDGVAEIYGCQESWTCDDIITNQIAFAGWDNITQTIAGYEAMFADASARADAGEPMVIYTWTPSAYITQLRPGDNVYWIGMENTLDDSNPSGVEGGEKHDQRYWTGTKEVVELAIPEDQCPAAADVGYCPLGWVPADIQVTANADFLDANPAAAALLRAAKLPVVEVSIANVDQSNNSWTEAEIAQAAAEWIETNRGQVDEWIAIGKSAA